jgi:DNA-binding CsgD family transcriptional regulator
MLIASGLTSRQVADRLYLSVRTVENHLHRLYTKLGVTSRDELSAALQSVPDTAVTS